MPRSIKRSQTFVEAADAEELGPFPNEYYGPLYVQSLAVGKGA